MPPLYPLNLSLAADIEPAAKDTHSPPPQAAGQPERFSRTRGIITSSHQDLVRALPGDKGNISHSLRTLEARGLMVIGRSPGGKAESLWLTPEGQKWASQLTRSCD